MGKTKVQIDGPLDVFDKIPSLLGFRPKNSLVILSAGSESDVVKGVKCVTLNDVASEKANNYQAILDSMDIEGKSIFQYNYYISMQNFFIFHINYQLSCNIGSANIQSN